MRGYTVQEAAKLLGGTLHGDGSREITGIVRDNREVTPGALFAALTGEKAETAPGGTEADDAGIQVLARGLRNMEPERRESLIRLIMPLVEQYQKKGSLSDDEPSLS